MLNILTNSLALHINLIGALYRLHRIILSFLKTVRKYALNTMTAKWISLKTASMCATVYKCGTIKFYEDGEHVRSEYNVEL